MNEVLIYGIQKLFSGENPYQFIYRLTIFTDYSPVAIYHQWLGYPPLSLIIYAPIMIFPRFWGSIQFNLIIYLINLSFDFLIFTLLWDEKRVDKKILAYTYWLLPFLSYIEYATFFSSIFFFMFAAVYYIDRPMLSGLFAMCAVLLYHLCIFILPCLFLYQIRNYIKMRYGEQSENHDNAKLTKQEMNSSQKVSYIGLFQRIWQDLRKKIKFGIKFIIGMLIPTIILMIFMIWDFNSLKMSLFDHSAERFEIAEFQFAFLGLVFFSNIMVLFFNREWMVKIYISIVLIVIFFIETLILNYSLTYFYFHYFALILPFGYMLCYYLFELRNEKKKANWIIRNEDGIKNS